MKYPEVAIIVPVFNEASVVGGVISDLKKSFTNVICIDDGSMDDSSTVISKAGGILVQHAVNLGQGAALQTGIEYALAIDKVKYFVTFDSDGQHLSSDINEMLKVLKVKKLDVVLGSRFLGQVENMPYLKKVILKAAIFFTNRSSGIKLTDTHNGLRAFNRKFAEALELKNSDMTHASEIVDRIVKGNFKYTEVPVTIRYTEYSRSKGQSMSNAVNIGLDIIFSRLVR